MAADASQFERLYHIAVSVLLSACLISQSYLHPLLEAVDNALQSRLLTFDCEISPRKYQAGTDIGSRSGQAPVL